MPLQATQTFEGFRTLFAGQEQARLAQAQALSVELQAHPGRHPQTVVPALTPVLPKIAVQAAQSVWLTGTELASQTQVREKVLQTMFARQTQDEGPLLAVVEKTAVPQAVH